MGMRALFTMTVAAAVIASCGGQKAEESGATSTGDNVGIPQCDEYISKMSACLKKMSPGEKAATEDSLKKTIDSWKTAMAQGGASRDALKQGCETALAQVPPSCK